jgi:L-fucose isomerase-like protein
MNSISSIDSELIELLRTELGFSSNASIRQESALGWRISHQVDQIELARNISDPSPDRERTGRNR